MRAAKFAVLCLVGTLFLANCGKKKPPKTPDTEPEPVASASAEAPEPPPKPKCESLDEKCIAEDTTRVEIASRGSFQPPKGWVYSKIEQGAMAVTEENDVAMLIITAEGNDPDKITAALRPVLDKMEITDAADDAIKKVLKKPPVVMDGDGIKLKTWEVSAKKPKQAPKMKGEPGKLLIFATESGDAMVGFVFAPDKAAPERLGAAAEALKTVRSGS